MFVLFGFFKFQHAEATFKQTVLNRWLIYQALPAKICMHLIVLGQASVHNLGSGWWGNSMCLGTVIAVGGLGVLRASLQRRMEEEKSLWAVWDNLTWELWQARTQQQIMLLFLGLIFTFLHDTFRLGERKEEKLSNFSLFSCSPLIPSNVLDPVDPSF